MTKQPAALTSIAGRMAAVCSTADTIGNENTLSASGRKVVAPKQKQKTPQHYHAELPSEESAGGGQQGRQALSFYIALDGESKQASEDLHAATEHKIQTKSVDKRKTPRNPSAWANTEQAPKQQERTSQYYQAELPSEESAGGGQQGRQTLLSLHIAQGEGNRQASQVMDMEKARTPRKLSAWTKTSERHPLQVGDSSLYLSHCSTEPTAPEESSPIQGQRLNFSHKYCKETSTPESKGDTGEITTVKTKRQSHSAGEADLPVLQVQTQSSSSSLCEKMVSYATLISGMFVEEESQLQPSVNDLFMPNTILEVRMESAVKSPAVSCKSGFSCCMRWVHILIALAVASTDGRMMISADAAFAPGSRTELQGDGGGTLGVFGCVGSCGRSPLRKRLGYTYCEDGGWTSGTGNPCNNANTNVPNGQGTGTYGTMGSWDVSKVDNMRRGKCSLLDFIIASPVYCNILSSRSCLSSACDVIY